MRIKRSEKKGRNEGVQSIQLLLCERTNERSVELVGDGNVLFIHTSLYALWSPKLKKYFNIVVTVYILIASTLSTLFTAGW